MSGEFERILLKNFGLRYKVRFNFDEEEYLEKVDDFRQDLREEKEKKASELFTKLEESRREAEYLSEGKAFFAPFYVAGASVKSKLNGDGIVQSCDSSSVSVYFPDPDKTIKYQFSDAIAKKFLYADDPKYAEGLQQYGQVLKNEKSITDRMTIREKEFEPYKDYLD